MQRSGDVYLLEDLLLDLLLDRHWEFADPAEGACKVLILVHYVNICHEIERLLRVEHLKPSLLKEIVYVRAVSPQEIKCHRVVVLDRLRYIDHPDFAMVVEHVVFGEVAMNKSAKVVHASHYEKDVHVCLLKVDDLSVLQAGGAKTLISDEFHDDDIVLE